VNEVSPGCWTTVRVVGRDPALRTFEGVARRRSGRPQTDGGWPYANDRALLRVGPCLVDYVERSHSETPTAHDRPPSPDNPAQYRTILQLRINRVIDKVALAGRPNRTFANTSGIGRRARHTPGGVGRAHGASAFCRDATLRLEPRWTQSLCRLQVSLHL